MKADFRSDTITKPSPAMLEAMLAAEVGDDVFGDDPTVIKLEHKIAEFFGMEAALFCASGTMANQIAINVHCQPGDEIICHADSHIYLYEGGGIAANTGASVRLLSGDRGRVTAQSVLDAINNPQDIHLATTKLISLENTMNKGGGSCYELSEMTAINDIAQKQGLKMHLDGARLFNAIVAKNQSPKDFGVLFDSISVCLSKGLGCPVGSVLIGSAAFINAARRVRKRLGGGWRQAGYLAAAGLYALEHNIERLSLDHQRAKALAYTLKGLPWVQTVFDTSTNIIIFELIDRISPQAFVDTLKTHGIACVVFGKNHIRFVTHLDISDEMIDYTINTLQTIKL